MDLYNRVYLDGAQIYVGKTLHKAKGDNIIGSGVKSKSTEKKMNERSRKHYFGLNKKNNKNDIVSVLF